MGHLHFVDEMCLLVSINFYDLTLIFKFLNSGRLFIFKNRTVSDSFKRKYITKLANRKR